MTKRIQDHGPSSNQRVVFATLELSEPIVRTRTYETAAWWTDIEIPAGKYEIGTNGYWTLAGLPGKITAEFMPSLFGGVAVGKTPPADESPNVGKDTRYGVQGYLYDTLAAIVERGGEWFGGQLTLVEGFSIEEETIVLPFSGNPHTKRTLVIEDRVLENAGGN